MYSEWSAIPLGLRLRIQAVNFFFYLVGVGMRTFLFIIGALGVLLLSTKNYIGLLPLGIALLLMWLDAQDAIDPKDWLKSKSHIVR